MLLLLFSTGCGIGEHKASSGNRATAYWERAICDPQPQDASLFRSAAWFRIFRFGDTPKSGRGHDEFDSNLCLSHEAIAAARDPAKQFVTIGGILNANYLIDLRGSGEKYQRTVIVHNDSFRLF
jgi:hypothetical protein